MGRILYPLFIASFFLIAGIAQGQYTGCGLTWGPIIEMSTGDSGFVGDHYHPLIAAIGDTIHYVWEPAMSTKGWFRMPYKRSTDDGITWEETRELLLDTIRFPWAPAHSTISSTDEGVSIFFSKSLVGDTDYTYALRTTDNGTTWSPPLRASASFTDIHYTGAYRGDTTASVHTALDLKVLLSSSADGGLTWREGAMVMPTSNYPWMTLTPGMINIVHSPWWDYGYYWVRETFLLRTSDRGDTWYENYPLCSLDGYTSDLPFMSSYIDDTCGTTILGVDWRDTKYGGLMFSASTIARLSYDDGKTWEEERVLTDEPRSQLCMITTNRNLVAASWTQEVVENDTDRIQARYSTDGGITWSTVCEVAPDHWWMTFATIAVTRTALHIAWEEIGDTCCKFHVYYRRGEFPHPDAQLTLSSSTFTFDTTPAGVPLIDTLTLNNPGTDTLHISRSIPENQDFKLIPQTVSVPPGESRSLQVVFQPVHEGGLEGKFILLSNSHSSPDCITMSGTSWWSAQTMSYEHPGQWQLVSKPLANGPSESMPSLYSFGTTYDPETVMVWGKGYWSKALDSITYHGAVVTDTLMEVRKGWNILGSISVPVSVGSLSSEPPGIISSGVYGYSLESGYTVTDTILPGKGYWVRVTADGKVLLRGDSP